MTNEQLARLFHDTYERLAPSFGYTTRLDTRAFDPESPNGKLMIAVVSEVMDRYDAAVTAPEPLAFPFVAAGPPFELRTSADGPPIEMTSTGSEPRAPRDEIGGWRCEYSDCQEWNEHANVSCKTCCRLRENRGAPRG